MATTFTGPVDSEYGFEEVYIDPSTGEKTIRGVVTTIPGVPLGADPSLVVGGGDSSLDFIPSNPTITPDPTPAAVIPYNVTTNMPTDNTINLGSAAARFQDIYTTGGVYFGDAPIPPIPVPPAVGLTSNYLDSYKEGTFTVTWAGDPVVSTNTTAYYTKIGRVVHWQYATGASVITSAAVPAELFGLPFIVLDETYSNGNITTATNTFFGGSATEGQQGYHVPSTRSAFFTPIGGQDPSTFVDGTDLYLVVSGTYLTSE